MEMRKQTSLLIALMVGAGVALAGCNKNSPETVGQKIDKATDKVAAKTESAMTKTAEVVDDAAITTKVKAAIMAEPGLKSLQIDVDTKDAVVTLSGTVDNAPMKDKAKEVAASVSGVKSVVDNLATKAG